MNRQSITHKNSFRFLNWKVYRDAQDVFGEVLKIVGSLPSEIRYTLGNQIIRSALSIVLNIAEGSGRHTDAELNRFFDIALGSINETVASLDALLKNNVITEDTFRKLFSKLEAVARQLGGFKKKIRNKAAI